MMAEKGEVNEDTVYRVAGSVGVDVDRLKRDMASPQIGAALKANQVLADALDIRGTPGFVIGDQIVPGAIELSSLKELVAGARKK
jgi:protein-disulfide isomerase